MAKKRVKTKVKRKSTSASASTYGLRLAVCGSRRVLALCQPKLTEWMRSHFPTNSPFEEPALSETKGGQGDVNFHSVKFFLMQGARSGSPIIIDLNSEP